MNLRFAPCEILNYLPNFGSQGGILAYFMLSVSPKLTKVVTLGIITAIRIL